MLSDKTVSTNKVECGKGQWYDIAMESDFNTLNFYVGGMENVRKNNNKKCI